MGHLQQNSSCIDLLQALIAQRIHSVVIMRHIIHGCNYDSHEKMVHIYIYILKGHSEFLSQDISCLLATYLTNNTAIDIKCTKG